MICEQRNETITNVLVRLNRSNFNEDCLVWLRVGVTCSGGGRGRSGETLHPVLAKVLTGVMVVAGKI